MDLRILCGKQTCECAVEKLMCDLMEGRCTGNQGCIKWSANGEQLDDLMNNNQRKWHDILGGHCMKEDLGQEMNF